MGVSLGFCSRRFFLGFFFLPLYAGLFLGNYFVKLAVKAQFLFLLFFKERFE